MKIPKLKRQYIRKFSLLKIFLVLTNHILNIQIEMMVGLSHVTILKKNLKTATTVSIKNIQFCIIKQQLVVI